MRNDFLTIIQAIRRILASACLVLLLIGCSDHDRNSSEEPTLSASPQLPASQPEQPVANLLRVASVINYEGTELSENTRVWLNEVFGELGFSPRLEFQPGRRVIIELNRGNIDVDLFRVVDISRGFDNVIRVDYPWTQACVLVVGLKDGREGFHDPGNQATVRSIGVISGAPGLMALATRQWPAAKVEEFKSDRQAALMLENQRVNFVLTTNVNLSGMKAGTPRPLAVYEIADRVSAYMHVHKRHEALIPDIIAHLKKHRYGDTLFKCEPEKLQAVLERLPE